MRTDNPRLTETNSAASKSVERVDTPVLKISEKKLVDRLVDVVSAYFLRLNIARKLMLGYSSLLALLVIISVYALINLNRLNDINSSILKTDLPAIDISKKMIDVLLAQELYARRYLLLGTADVRMLFLDKTGEFDRLVEQVMSVPEHRKFPIEEIVRLHKTYTQLLFQGMQ